MQSCLTEENLQKLFEIFLSWRLVYPPPSIYWFKHLFTSIGTHGYLYFGL